MPTERSAAPLDLEVDLDGAATPEDPPAPPPRPGARRRRRLAAALAVLLVGGGLVVAQRVQREREAQVEITASDAELLGVRRPSSANYNTLVSVSVDLRNAGPSTVTLRSVRTGGVGALLRDDLRGSGGDARGLEQGTRIAPGEAATVVLSGALQCPGSNAPPPVAGALALAVGAADGTERAVEAAAPPRGAGWVEAFARACALGPLLDGGTAAAVGDATGTPYRSALRLHRP